MCGIAGFISRSRNISKSKTNQILDRLNHRGPDDRGTWSSDNITLGHTRLAIIDLESGHQPIATPDNRAAVVANGEIYNYIEIKENLSREGIQFTTNSDSETILQTYLRHGTNGINQLHGMFSFAIYDHKESRLILARDRLGMKPLYYAELPEGIAFASELKALRPILGNNVKINENSLIQYLQNQFNTGRDTIFSGIKRALPGEIITIDKKLNIHPIKYWSPSSIKTRKITQNEACEIFTPLMDLVINEHIRSDVPYGLFLSGGVDSAVLLSLIQEKQSRPLRTFSIGYKNSSLKSELAGAQRMAKLFNSDH
ncbi:asparagine synthase (glutamine-hydrolyzing), partial [Ectothiorhodospira lacustris]|uniref:asparagine synthase (glutamine-hydrolyzing) n=1 Tax=Ectothiorhodospira lacustris TaxID=2899127 RepID=UPI001EE96899